MAASKDQDCVRDAWGGTLQENGRKSLPSAEDTGPCLSVCTRLFHLGQCSLGPTQGSPGLSVFVDTGKDADHGGPQSDHRWGINLLSSEQVNSAHHCHLLEARMQLLIECESVSCTQFGNLGLLPETADLDH